MRKDDVDISHIRGPVHIQPKVWGRELWLHNDERYCGKILEIKAGKQTSLHFHKIKYETLYLHKGSVKLVLQKADGTPYERVMKEGEMIDIVPRQVHRISALEDSEIFEFSTQHREDDSHRMEIGN